MQRKKLIFFTLLEVLIALGITMILLSTLLGAYFQAAKITAQAYMQTAEMDREKTVHRRLENIFRHLIKPDQVNHFFYTSEGTSAFYLPGSPTLLFSYDNGVLLRPSLSGPVLGKLCIDPKGNLTLLTWPERESWSEERPSVVHREVLLENVSAMRFQFFAAASEKEGQRVTEAGWRKDGIWTKEEKALPGIIQLTLLRQQGKEFTFTFVVPQVLGVIKIKE